MLLDIFNDLYDELIFPAESFIAWQDDTTPSEQEGKGIFCISYTLTKLFS